MQYFLSIVDLMRGNAIFAVRSLLNRSLPALSEVDQGPDLSDCECGHHGDHIRRLATYHLCNPAFVLHQVRPGGGALFHLQVYPQPLPVHDRRSGLNGAGLDYGVDGVRVVLEVGEGAALCHGHQHGVLIDHAGRAVDGAVHLSVLSGGADHAQARLPVEVLHQFL